MAKILIKDGRIFDGERFFFANVLTDGEKIAKIAPDIEENADFVFDASGKTVLPGLVDAHVHISGGDFSINAEMSAFPFGVTCVADAGVCYPEKLNGCDVKNVVFVNISIKNNYASFENTIKTLSECSKKTIGLKIYFDKTISDVTDITSLSETVKFAESRGLIVMVHSSNPPVSMSELLGILRKGDILTHAYHGGESNVSDDGYECIKNAKERGVIIDAGMAGHIHTDFDVFRGAIECGAIPDVISTDITRYSAYKRGGKYGLPMCMSIAKHLGMTEKDIFKAVTSAPAKALDKENEWGHLSVGRTADICVLEYTDEGFDLTDKAENNIKSSVGYRNILTVADGEIVYLR